MSTLQELREKLGCIDSTEEIPIEEEKKPAHIIVGNAMGKAAMAISKSLEEDGVKLGVKEVLEKIVYSILADLQMVVPNEEKDDLDL